MKKSYKPTSPGRRQMVLPSNRQLTAAKGQPTPRCKSLTQMQQRSGGRNHHGHITCRHRGGGHKRLYRRIDFQRQKDGIWAQVASIEYDPNRSAHIALLHYLDGEKRYILASEGLQRGDRVCSGSQAPFRSGCAMPLRDMPSGSIVHNIETIPGRGGKLVRSAGLSAQLMACSDGYATLKMPSGEVRLIHSQCRATFGAVCNGEWSGRVEGKAGRKRWRGIRPTVRGTAMNPVDHPHGGGEGKHNGYLPQTPWGQYTKGLRTRSRRKSRRWIVKDRRHKATKRGR